MAGVHYPPATVRDARDIADILVAASWLIDGASIEATVGNQD